jgi:hypothetical protein
MEWGSPYNDRRGDELSSFIISLDLRVCNQGNKPTFERGSSHSILDLTFASAHTARRIAEWNVLEEETGSDHNYLYYTVDSPIGNNENVPLGWCRKKLDIQKLKEYLRNKETPRDAYELMEIMKEACDASMPRIKNTRKHHKPQHWWTDEIAELRKESLKARRRYQKALKRSLAEEEKKSYKDTKKNLRIAIRWSQDNCWRNLIDKVDQNPWGTAYRIVMNKIGKRSPIPTDMIPAIVSELFPTHTAIEVITDKVTTRIPPVTNQEVEAASARLRIGKAPGPDGVPNEVLKVAVKTRPEMFQKIFSQCMIDGVFPIPWKRTRLVLLRKGNKPADQPSNYRPLCMLDTTGKLFERIVCNRIEEALDKERTGLAENQYGFRKRRSTIDAIQRVLTEVTEASAGTIYQRQLCVLVTLDVANAFNSAFWAEIINAMRNKNVPNYLTRLIQNYFRDREIKYSEEHEAVQLSSGVPQGSVLGPLLWGIMYDSLLTTETPEGVIMVGFADDVEIIGRAWRIEHLEEIINESLRIVNEWMISKKLRLAPHKTEAVMLTRKRGYRKPTFVLGDQQITTKNSLRYLGVEIDIGRRFAVHEKIVGAKAA